MLESLTAPPNLSTTNTSSRKPLEHSPHLPTPINRAVRSRKGKFTGPWAVAGLWETGTRAEAQRQTWVEPDEDPGVGGWV